MSFKNLGLNVKRLIENTGSAEGAAEKLNELINKNVNGVPTSEAQRIMSEFSLRETAEQLRIDGMGSYVPLRPGYLSEAISTTQFSIIIDTLLSKKILNSYNAFPGVLSQLVTPFDSRMQIDKIPGLFLTGDLSAVAEGMPYPQNADIKDKYVQVEGEKRGIILNVPEEAVLFDQTGTMLMKAGQIGELCAMDREKRGIYTILDISNGGVNYYSWYPAGTRAAIWANAGGAGNAHEYDNLIVDVLQDYTDLDAAKVALANMKDDNGNPIAYPATHLLVPTALDTQALRLITNTVVPGGANTENNPFYNKAQVVSTPFIDGSGDGNATTCWFWGNFKRQFVEKKVFGMQVLNLTGQKNNEMGFSSDIIARYKVREYTQVGALDYRYVVKSTGAGA